MDDGADDFYRGLISASAFVARMSEPMSQRRDRHMWKSSTRKLKFVASLFGPMTNVPFAEPIIVGTCSPISGTVSVAGLPAARHRQAFVAATSSSSGF